MYIRQMNSGIGRGTYGLTVGGWDVAFGLCAEGGIYRWLTPKHRLHMGRCLATGDSIMNTADKILASRQLH